MTKIYNDSLSAAPRPCTQTPIPSLLKHRCDVSLTSSCLIPRTPLAGIPLFFLHDRLKGQLPLAVLPHCSSSLELSPCVKILDVRSHSLSFCYFVPPG